MSNEKICFVIAPIGDTDSETRKRSDLVLNYIIKPAATECGYRAVRADEIDKPGIITSQVIQHIVSDELVIADLTERNPNVFYELAIRHAIRKPYVQIIQKGEAIPFDVAGTRTIHVDHNDLQSADSAKREIMNQIKSFENGDNSDIETPISVSIDLQILRQSEKPEERSLADLLSSVVELRTSMTKLESKIGTTDQAGILDEIQTSLRNLPHRLDDLMESPRIPWSKKGGFHPMMLQDFLHMGPHRTPGIGFLIIASVFRDWMPWLYELGLEVYRLSKKGRSSELEDAVAEFRHAVEFALHGPMSREFVGKNKQMYFLIEEIEPMLDRTMSMLEDESRPAKKK